MSITKYLRYQYDVTIVKPCTFA